MFCQVWVIICSTHRNVMELGKLTWKTRTFLRPDVFTKGDCKSSVILKNWSLPEFWIDISDLFQDNRISHIVIELQRIFKVFKFLVFCTLMNVLPVNYCITLYKNIQSTLKMGQQVPWKHRYLSTKLLGSTCQNKTVFISVLLLVGWMMPQDLWDKSWSYCGLKWLLSSQSSLTFLSECHVNWSWTLNSCQSVFLNVHGCDWSGNSTLSLLGWLF